MCVHVCSRMRAHECARVRVCARARVCMRDVFAIYDTNYLTQADNNNN